MQTECGIQFDDGTYPKGRWAWIDTDNDGMAEGFYFDSNGYVLRNTTTPDGYQVNRIGAWVVGGEVKQKPAARQRTVRQGTAAVQKIRRILTIATVMTRNGI